MVVDKNETEKRRRAFAAHHVSGNPFVLANTWDIGTARLVEAAGAVATATSSWAYAFTLGKKDGNLTRDESIEHLRAMAKAVDIPVSGDLENGYGERPSEVAETIEAAMSTNAAGASIEDVDTRSGAPYSLNQSVERIEAAVDVIRRNDSAFVLTARADGVLYGKYSVDDAITRIQAFEKAGANVLFVPLPPNMDALAKICRSVSAPVNALAAGSFLDHSVADYASAGAARISLGSSLFRKSTSELVKTVNAMLSENSFSILKHNPQELNIAGVLDP